jgi:hypothetical protein
LNVRRQQRQVNDLRHARPCEPRKPGDLRVVLHRPLTDQTLKMVAEDEQSGDLRHDVRGVDLGVPAS